MNTQKLTRTSIRGTEYQIEYTPTKVGTATEYKVRRGTNGTWTKPLKTSNMNTVLVNLGFTFYNPLFGGTYDFAFESLLSRGEIYLNEDAVTYLANTVGENQLSAHCYSRLKSSSDREWVLPSSAITDNRIFEYVLTLIKAHV